MVPRKLFVNFQENNLKRETVQRRNIIHGSAFPANTSPLPGTTITKQPTLPRQVLAREICAALSLCDCFYNLLLIMKKEVHMKQKLIRMSSFEKVVVLALV